MRVKILLAFVLILKWLSQPLQSNSHNEHWDVFIIMDNAIGNTAKD
jgi:hypothetical protein